MLFTYWEIFDAIIMILGVAFIFKSMVNDFLPHKDDYDPLKQPFLGIDWHSFWLTVLVTAPAIVFHELAHKLVAISFGFVAVFHAAYTWLAIGVVLKLLNFPFIFIVPGFVSIYGNFSPLQHAIIAFSGPGLNLVLWLTSYCLYKFKIVKKRKYVPLLMITSRINMLLFFFNMLPLPIFDGWSVYEGLFRTFF